MALQKNLENDHYNLDGLYELTLIASIILAGIAGAANKCSEYKGTGTGTPLCIPSGDVIRRGLPRQNGGANLDEVNKHLVANATMNSATPGGSHLFTNLAQTITGKLYNLVENSARKILGTQTLANNADIEKNLTDFLVQNAALIRQLTRDPDIQEALRKWVEEVGILNIQLMDMAKPTIDRLVNKATETINEASTKVARGIMSTGLNFLEAFIGEIPVAGGIIDIIIAFMRGFNSAMQASAPVVEFSTEAFFKALKTAFVTVDILKTKSEDIANAALNVQGAVQGAVQGGVENIMTNVKLPEMPVPSKVLENFEQKGKEAGEAYVNTALAKLPAVPMTVPSASNTSASNTIASNTSASNTSASNTSASNTSAEDLALEERFKKLKSAELPKKELPKKLPVPVRKGGSIAKRIKHVTQRLRKTINGFMNKNIKKNKTKKTKILL